MPPEESEAVKTMSENFRGTYPHTIDSKGRMSVPTKFREVLGGGENLEIVITRSINLNSLACFPRSRWAKVEQQALDIPSWEEREMFIHNFISVSQDCTLDRMGRVLIPSQLRAEAELDREVMVVGALTKFEIWDRAKWESYDKETRDKSSDLLKKSNIVF